MKQLLLGLTVLAFVFACGDSNSEGKLATNTPPKPPKKKVDGAKIYKLNCVVCHGIAGDMGVNGAANLGESPLTMEERIEVITNGRNTMQAFGSLLKEEEIAAVAKYTTKLGK